MMRQYAGGESLGAPWLPTFRKHLHTKAGIDAIISVLFAKAGALIRQSPGIAIISLLKDSGVQEVLPRLFSAKATAA